jgi:hypothetical protein
MTVTSQEIQEQAKMLVDRALVTHERMGQRGTVSEVRYQRAVSHAAAAIRQLADASSGWGHDGTTSIS